MQNNDDLLTLRETVVSARKGQMLGELQYIRIELGVQLCYKEIKETFALKLLQDTSRA